MKKEACLAAISMLFLSLPPSLSRLTLETCCPCCRMRSLLEEEEKEEEEEVLGAASAPVGDMETPRASSARRRDGSILREENS